MVTLGTTALLGWLLHNEALKTILPWVDLPIKANTAMAMLLSGAGLFLLSRKGLTNTVRVCAATAAAGVILLSVLTLGEFLSGWNFGIDTWLTGENPAVGGISDSGRMSPITALCFALVGVALWSTARRLQKPLQLPMVSGLGGILVAAGAVPLFGLLLEMLFGPGWNYMGVDAARITGAAAFLLLGVGLLALLIGHSHLTWSLDRLSTVGIATGFILMILASGLFHNFALRVRQAEAQISHSQRVLTEIEEIEGDMFALENERQRYFIRGDEALLGGWNALKLEVSEHVRELQQLVGENSHQQPRIRELSALAMERVSWAQAMIEERREKGLAVARDRANEARGDRLSTRSAELVKVIEKEEQRRLEGYQGASELASQQESQMLPLGVFFCCAILSLGLFFLNSGMGERKHAESLLIESQQRLDLARIAADIGIWDWNVVTNELVWDDRMYEICGIRAQDFSGAYNAWQKGLHPDDRARAEAEIMAAVKSAAGFHTEFRVVWPDGNIRNIEAHAITEHAPDGSTTRMIGVNYDITERKRVESELQVQQSELRVLFDLMPAMIWFKDVTNGILRVNKRVADAIGKTVDEIEGKPSLEIYPEEAARFYQDDLKVIQSGAAQLGIVETVAGADGNSLWVQTDKVPVLDGVGKVIGIVVMAQDITERKKADGALEEANRQLRDASRQAGMAEVATSVLHNVGNVLNSVNVSCTVISDKVRASRITGVAKTADALQAHAGDLGAFFATDEVGRKLPDFLARLALRLSGEQSEILGELQLLSQNIEHIKDIVAVQQNHAKEVGGVRETLPLEGLMEDALRINAAALIRHQIEIVREYGDAPPLPLEKHKVVQILVNLVRNAKHAMIDGGGLDKRLVVRIARHNGSVAVSVSDNGIGIAPENKIRIFSHGFTTKKDGHGFGLHSGVLAAQEMGGSLVAQSDGLGQGATFTLELPFEAHEKG